MNGETESTPPASSSSNASSLLHSLLPLSCILLLLSVSLVQHYAAPGTSCSTRLLVIVSFTLGFGGVALLPLDLSLSHAKSDATEEADNGWTPEVNETYTAWEITYWTTFFLTWVVLPTVREILLSGRFSVLARVRDGIGKSCRRYVFLMATAVTTIVTLAIFTKSWPLPVLMALGNTYGLLLVSVLMGYGLVDIPRRVWRQAQPDQELRRVRIIATAADEALFEAVWALQDVEQTIDDTVAAIQRWDGESENKSAELSPEEIYYRRCVSELVEQRNSTAQLAPALQGRRASPQRRRTSRTEADLASTMDGSNKERPSLGRLAELRANLKVVQAQLVSAEQRWSALVDESRFYSSLASGVAPPPSHAEALLSRQSSGALQSSDSVHGGSSTIASGANASSTTVPNDGMVAVGNRRQRQEVYLIQCWLLRLRTPCLRIFAMILAALSAGVLWSEATLSLKKNLSPFALFLVFFSNDVGEDENPRKGLLFQLMALIPLLYMSTCVYGSLFKLSTFGPYCLRGSKQSHGVALLFNAQYLVRLQFPLGYNYLLMLKYDTSSTTCAFSRVMANMSTVPFFGKSFSVYAPLLILALCCFTLCDGYARLLSALGIEHEDSMLVGDAATLDSKVNEGINLLRRHEERRVSGGGGGSETVNNSSDEDDANMGTELPPRKNVDSTSVTSPKPSPKHLLRQSASAPVTDDSIHRVTGRYADLV